MAINYHFYLSINPGLEEALINELKDKISYHHFDVKIIKMEKGGVEIETTQEVAIYLNFILKTPTRILQRIFTFKCRDFPKMFKKISNLNWDSYLIGQRPIISISSKNSRLFDSRRIENSFYKGLDRFYQKKTPRKIPLQLKQEAQENTTIYLRMLDDICTLSYDLSGQPLYKRGNRSLAADAPIRENIAAALLTYILPFIKDEKNIIDPMCGTGTFLNEALNYYKINPRANFSYQYLPASPQIPKFEDQRVIAEEFYGFDREEKVLNIAIEQMDPFINFKCADLFQDEQNVLENNIVVSNPPYGKRLKRESFEQYLKAITSKFNPSLIGIIWPEDNKTFIGFEKKKKISFFHGGLDLFFYIFTKID